MKQQKSLLSFFSPPSAKDSSKKPTQSSKTGSDTTKLLSTDEKKLKNSTSKHSNVSKQEKSISRKRIDFSPKVTRKPLVEKAINSKPQEVSANGLTDKKTNTKRKAPDIVDGNSMKDRNEIPDQTKSFKRLRRHPIRIVDDDNDDSDVEMEEVIQEKISDSEEEWSKKESESEASMDDEEDSDTNESSDEFISEEEEEDLAKPKQNKKKSSPVVKTPLKLQSKVSTVTPPSPNEHQSGEASGAGNHLHDRLPWLHKDRRDINRNRPDSPNYDSRTLYVPPEFLKTETPAMVQWWEVKSRNMDTILFFKVGKFYELFHMDADVGFKELALIYMKGEKAHSGFPEIAYGKMSSQLIAKGYRVARVEQTETPEMMKERNKTSKKKAKVVRREVCSLLSIGTNTRSFLDGTSISSSVEPKHLLAIKEGEKVMESSTSTSSYGICIIDCATAAIQLAEFHDTEQRDRLRTLLAQFNVVEIVSERGNLSSFTRDVFKHACANAVRGELQRGKEFFDAHKTIEELQNGQYFTLWPEVLQSYINEDNTAKPGGFLALSALGGCLFHLKRSLIDDELLSLCRFKQYRPSDDQECQSSKIFEEGKHELQQKYVVLDTHTIKNLEILVNNVNQTRTGSLLHLMDHTTTSFGKRMFQDWLLKPLCKVTEINQRLDMVEELGRNLDLIQDIRAYLKQCPDLERLLSRIHAFGLDKKAQNHPHSRAIMYEMQTYNIRKIRDFLAVLNGFDVTLSLLNDVGPRFKTFKSPTLRQLMTFDNDGGQFPSLHSHLEFFKKSFDLSTAEKTGEIIPHEGVDQEYDSSVREIAEIEAELDTYLTEQKKLLHCSKLTYFSTKKKEDRYQLEVPESIQKLPKAYELKSRRKGYKRFHTEKIRTLLKQLAVAEERQDSALKDQMRRIFHAFDGEYPRWIKAVECLSVLDCLVSLTLVSTQSDEYVRPEVVSTDEPFLEIYQGKHPCVASTLGDAFIPNDTLVGCEGSPSTTLMLLSGPNMGGKSTLLRQTCILTLMAQVGCYVPASSCRLSPVDRIFTRLGASDRILAGQSTLFVELAETATILNHATQHSLVILDELGRGTSTFDGTAIAYAVVEHLLKDTRCRSLFATHYHSLVEEFTEHPNVTLGHMGCLVDPQNDKKVTFLYKLEPGMCPKSYGINVAMLANLPEEVIELASKKSTEFEASLSEVKVKPDEENIVLSLQKLCNGNMHADDPETIRMLWKQAKKLVENGA